MKDIGKLCSGCFVHGDSPEQERAPQKNQEVCMVIYGKSLKVSNIRTFMA